MADFINKSGGEMRLPGDEVVPPGGKVSLTKERQEDEHNKFLIDQGFLVPASTASSEPARRTGPATTTENETVSREAKA